MDITTMAIIFVTGVTAGIITSYIRRKGSARGAKLYQCSECKMHYRDEKWAKKCEAWCHEHQSCNLEIIEHAEENKQ